MEPQDFLKQVIDKVAERGVGVDKKQLLDTPADWPCTIGVELGPTLDGDSMERAVNGVIREHGWLDGNCPGRRLELVAMEVCLNRDGGHDFGFRLRIILDP